MESMWTREAAAAAAADSGLEENEKEEERVDLSFEQFLRRFLIRRVVMVCSRYSRRERMVWRDLLTERVVVMRTR